MNAGTNAPAGAIAGARRVYLILIGLSVAAVLFQYVTSGEFITEDIPLATRQLWTLLHGLGAYPVMLTAAAATLVAQLRLRSVPGVRSLTAMYFGATVLQWLLGHAVTTLRIHALTPVHVVMAAIVVSLAALLLVRAARWRRHTS